jgi:hypothetical protein
MVEPPTPTAVSVSEPPTTAAAKPEEKKVKRFNNGWSADLEHLVADWADKGQCYRWMHDKTSRKQAAYNQCMMIPVIVLSTLTGTANFGLDSLFSDPAHKKIASLSIGGFGILTGVISTLANFMRYAQGSEAHSVAAISWAKFSRHTSIELALHPNDRIEAFAFLKMFRIELDRLIEQSPPIPDDIVRSFKQEFRNNSEVKRPEITGYMEHTPVFDNKNERLKALAAEVSLALQHKKKLLRDMVMDDIDMRVRKVAGEALAEAQNNSAVGKVSTGQPLSSSMLKFINSRAEPRKKDVIIDVDEATEHINTIHEGEEGDTDGDKHGLIVNGERIYDKTR